MTTRRAASDALNPRAVEWLLSTEPFRLRVEGRHLIGWWSDADSPAECVRRVRVLAGVADNIPRVTTPR